VVNGEKEFAGVVLTTERFRTSAMSHSLNIINNTSKGGIVIQDSEVAAG